VEIVWVKPVADRSTALREEWRIKQLTRAEKWALVRSVA
jgi:predicted GIY-YIG superfamily endonuclease